MPGRGQNTLLVQEVMEEEWNALKHLEERCPEVMAQVGLGYLFSETVLQHQECLVSIVLIFPNPLNPSTHWPNQDSNCV